MLSFNAHLCIVVLLCVGSAYSSSSIRWFFLMLLLFLLRLFVTCVLRMFVLLCIGYFVYSFFVASFIGSRCLILLALVERMFVYVCVCGFSCFICVMLLNYSYVVVEMFVVCC